MNIREIESLSLQGRREIINKTRTYLAAPTIRMYGELFLERVRNLYIFACAISDKLQPLDSKVYLLVDVSKSNNFSELLPIFQQYDFVYDYPFGKVLNSYYHVLAIDADPHAHAQFLNSRYSKMFSHQDIQDFIVEPYGLTKAAQTMLRTKERFNEFELEINEYGKYIVTDDKELEDKVAQNTWISLAEDSELDYMIDFKKETLNS